MGQGGATQPRGSGSLHLERGSSSTANGRRHCGRGWRQAGGLVSVIQGGSHLTTFALIRRVVRIWLQGDGGKNTVTGTEATKGAVCSKHGVSSGTEAYGGYWEVKV